MGRMRYTLALPVFKTARSSSAFLLPSTRPMAGLSRKWVWLCAVETTPERSRSAFCKWRLAALATKLEAALLASIFLSIFANSSGPSVRSCRTWIRLRSSSISLAAAWRMSPVNRPRASSFQNPYSTSRAPRPSVGTSISAMRRASSTASSRFGSMSASGL